MLQDNNAMNRQITVLLLAVSFLVGCANLEKTSYQVVGTTAALVDGAMNGWGDWVRANKATPQDEVVVKAAYIQYQQAMGMAKTAIFQYRLSGDKVSLEQTLDVLDVAKNKLVDLIITLRK